MDFVFGRDNLALTVFVPWDCHNHCSFCTSKDSYRVNEPSLQNVKYQMRRFFQFYDFPVKVVVFTGGEPMMNIPALAELIDLVPKDKRIFINTTFIKATKGEFLDLVDKGRISGVNISRHGETYEEDCKMMCGIADDEEILDINCSVRINCVLKGQCIGVLVERWRDKGVTLNLREDYTLVVPRELHDPYRPVPMELFDIGYHFWKHTQCRVCDTTYFEPEDLELPTVMYHKGLQDSSILEGDVLEINDLIIDQTGALRYDWRHTDLETLGALLAEHFLPCPEFAIGHRLNIEKDDLDSQAKKKGLITGCGGYIARSEYQGCGGGKTNILGHGSPRGCGGGC